MSKTALSAIFKAMSSSDARFVAIVLMFLGLMLSDKYPEDKLCILVNRFRKLSLVEPISKLRFHSCTPPRCKLICRLYFLGFCCDVDFWSSEYKSALKNESQRLEKKKH